MRVVFHPVGQRVRVKNKTNWSSCFIQWICCLIFQNLIHVHSRLLYKILKNMIVLLVHVVLLFHTMATSVQIFCKSEKLFMIALDTGFAKLWYKSSFTYNLKTKTWIHYDNNRNASAQLLTCLSCLNTFLFSVYANCLLTIAARWLIKYWGLTGIVMLKTVI